MNPKKRILILCDWFLPGFLAGGPIQSIAALTHHLKDDFEFKIVTADTDFKATAPYENIKPDTWTTCANRQVYYISRKHLNTTTMLRLIKETPHDVLYLNSMFSKFFTIVPLQLKRKNLITSHIVLAPRGMLSKGALKTKPIKKTVFLAYAKAFGLFNGIQWQSTSPQETKEIKQRIGENVNIVEASNLPNMPDQVSVIEKKPGELKLCYVARICETKNLLFAVEVLGNCGIGNIEFDVYGPIEDPDYWSRCLELAKQLPATISFHYKNAIMPQQVGQVMSAHHALFLPTHNENFGHAIVECLQSARPVIISDQTPWRHLEQEQMGFDISLDDRQKFVDAINSLVKEDNPGFQKRCQVAMAYISDKLCIENIKKAYLTLFS